MFFKTLWISRQIKSFRKGIDAMTIPQKGALILGTAVFKEVIRQEGLILEPLTDLVKNHPEYKTHILLVMNKLSKGHHNTMLPAGGLVWLYSAQAIGHKSQEKEMKLLWNTLALAFPQAEKMKKTLEPEYKKSTGQEIPFDKNHFIPKEFI